MFAFCFDFCVCWLIIIFLNPCPQQGIYFTSTLLDSSRQMQDEVFINITNIPNYCPQ